MKRRLFLALVLLAPLAQAELRFDLRGAGAPLYDEARGHGFVTQTLAQPPRTVHIPSKDGTISEPAFDGDNSFGMALRIKAAPGAYAVRVRTTSDAADTTVSVAGMQTSRLLGRTFWDAAETMPNKTTVSHQGKEWTYRYVNGQDYIDIEVEPKRPGTTVGLEEVVLTPIAPQQRPAGALPAIYTLGDSTVKTYTFDEAPMSGWGQVFDKLFDPGKVRVINYSMGGRSFRSAYSEGRLNDLLLAGYEGDVVLIQFGHNDESDDAARRFGRGATEAMYQAMLTQVYLPAIRARGMVPVLVTPMARVPGTLKPGQAYADSFKTRRFPGLLRQLGAAHNVPVIDLNARSVEYYNQAGPDAIGAMIMSIEAGETPGKTNDGSYANGHPANKIDGTHFKESLSKQYARMVAEELTRLGKQGDPVAAGIAALLLPATGQSEVAADIRTGEGAYYRNQIEKLLQLGVLRKDGKGNFNPQAPMRAREFAAALATLMAVALPPQADAVLTRAAMGALLADAYHLKYSARPAYMTAYNGKTVLPGAAGYDPNLDSGAQGAMYYPLVRWEQLTDSAGLPPKVKDAYELGLIRSEEGIARGRMINGRVLAPNAVVTRAKAAKALYFMWVLAQPPKAENDIP